MGYLHLFLGAHVSLCFLEFGCTAFIFIMFSLKQYISQIVLKLFCFIILSMDCPRYSFLQCVYTTQRQISLVDLKLTVAVQPFPSYVSVMDSVLSKEAPCGTTVKRSLFVLVSEWEQGLHMSWVLTGTLSTRTHAYTHTYTHRHTAHT